MKKTIILVVALSTAFVSGHLYAQDSNARRDLVTSEPIDANRSATASSGVPGYHSAAISTINVHAIKDLKRRFTKVAGEKWAILDKGSCVVFTKDSVTTRVFYGLKGQWQASITYCDEWKIPFFVRDMVRKAYYDLPITVVEIINVPDPTEIADRTVYLVHVEDKNICKIIRVSQEGDMDVLKEFAKTN